MEMDYETVKKLNEIRAQLKESHPSRKKEAPSPYLGSRTVEKKKKKRERQSNTNKEYEERVSFQTREEAALRSISLPFLDNLYFVNETLKLSNQPKSVGISGTDGDVNVSREYFKTLRSRFPRFLEGIDLGNEDVSIVKKRTDIWLARFIEDALDATFAECSKSVNLSRVRIRYNLDLGAMDAFPLNVRRFVAQRFR